MEGEEESEEEGETDIDELKDKVEAIQFMVSNNRKDALSNMKNISQLEEAIENLINK